jgi:DNA-binding MarR family transcriptional regulator
VRGTLAPWQIPFAPVNGRLGSGRSGNHASRKRHQRLSAVRKELTLNTSISSLPTSTEPLVDALATRLRHADLIGWAQITARAEELGLSFEGLRLLLALTTGNGPSRVSDLAHISGLPLDAAYPAIQHLRGRGYVREKRRQYSLNEDGRELVAILDAAHREGIQAYVDQLDPRERQRLAEVLRDHADKCARSPMPIFRSRACAHLGAPIRWTL